jgi:hypothetical protein
MHVGDKDGTRRAGAGAFPKRDMTRNGRSGFSFSFGGYQGDRLQSTKYGVEGMEYSVRMLCSSTVT